MIGTTKISECRLPLIGIERLRMGIDGTGVRTLIGTAGCPLRCSYCLNPHSWDGTGKIRNFSPEELYERVQIDNLYFQASGGGVTFGGGEPMLHIQEIQRFRRICPDSWSFWIETSLQAEAEHIRIAAEVFDHFVVDIKTTDPDIYRAYTGGDCVRSMENLKLLLELVGPDRITVRVPLIPGYVDETSRRRSAELLETMGILHTDWLTYYQQIP